MVRHRECGDESDEDATPDDDLEDPEDEIEEVFDEIDRIQIQEELTAQTEAEDQLESTALEE